MMKYMIHRSLKNNYVDLELQHKAYWKLKSHLLTTHGNEIYKVMDEEGAI